MNLAIVFLTGRVEPRLDWLCDALERQAHADDRIALVVIDHLATQPDRSLPGLGWRAVPCVTRVTHAAPKPCPWAGPHRITDRDWWSKSSSANTGLVLVPPDVNYVVLMDDRARPGPRWLEAIRGGYLRRDAVLAGAYERVETRGDVSIITRDHRMDKHPRGHRNCGGGWLFGCTMALPLAWALEVNGFEEGCDSLTGEDYMFGLMLHNAGRRIDYDAELFVTIDRTIGNASCKAAYVCTDKGVSPHDKSHAALARFGKRKRTEFTPELRELRARWHTLNLGAAAWPMPDPEMRDWFDGQRVVEMRPPS